MLLAWDEAERGAEWVTLSKQGVTAKAHVESLVSGWLHDRDSSTFCY